MKPKLLTPIPLTCVLLGLSACEPTQGPSASGAPKPPPKTVPIEISDDANLSAINAGDTIQFTLKDAPNGEFWVRFKHRTPCKGGKEVLIESPKDSPRTTASCETNERLDPTKIYPFTHGLGTKIPTTPPHEVTDSAVTCKPYCQ